MYTLHLYSYTTTPAHTAKLAQNWIATNCSDFFGHQTHQTLILLITMSGKLCLNATRHFNQSQIPSTSWRKSCKQYGMICHRTPSTRPYELCKKTSSLCESLGRTLWTRLEINFFAGFWTVSKLWQSEMSNFHVFIWFQYKHYDENCNFHSNCVTW